MATIPYTHSRCSSSRLRTLPAPVLETSLLDMMPDTLLQLLELFVLRLVLGMLDGDIRSDSLMDLEKRERSVPERQGVTHLVQSSDSDNDGRCRARANIPHTKADGNIFDFYWPRSDR